MFFCIFAFFASFFRKLFFLHFCLFCLHKFWNQIHSIIFFLTFPFVTIFDIFVNSPFFNHFFLFLEKRCIFFTIFSKFFPKITYIWKNFQKLKKMVKKYIFLSKVFQKRWFFLIYLNKFSLYFFEIICIIFMSFF